MEYCKTHFVSSLLPNTDPLHFVRIIMVYSAPTRNSLQKTCTRLYVRVGKMVLLISPPSTARVSACHILRNMSQAIVVIRKFLAQKSANRSSFIVDVRLSALCTLVHRRTKKLSIRYYSTEIMDMIKAFSILSHVCPCTLNLRSSPSVGSIARSLLQTYIELMLRASKNISR